MDSTCLITEKVLILEPSELHFGGPLMRPTITLITLKNPNNFDVMYKFKTTAPRIYRVRPNLGIVSSHGDKTVRIVLMPFSFELKERLVHKFMVLTAPAPDDYSDLRKVWAGLDEGKLRCEKFKSIIEMVRTPMASNSLEMCSSSTSAECEQEPPASCAGDTSQSDENMHSRNHTLVNAPSISIKTTTAAMITTTMSPSTPRLDTSLAILAELRAENHKLRDLNDVLRRENKQLAYELERIRDVKLEMEGSMAEMANEPKRATTGRGKTNNKLMLFLATSMTMAIVCAVIGKFVFPEKVNLDGLQAFLESVVN